MWRDIFNFVGGFAALPLVIGGLTANEFARLLVRLSLRPSKNYKIVAGAREGYFNCMAKRGGGNALVLGFSESDKQCDINKEKEHFLRRVLSEHSFENLTYRLGVKKGYLCYEKVPNFDISNHVKIWRGSGNGVIPQKELLTKILPALSKPIPIEQPPWEWIILPNVQMPDNPVPETLRIFRMHQSYTNGFGAHELFYQMMDWETEDGKPPYIFDPWKPVSHKDWMAWIGEVLGASFCLPPRIISDSIYPNKDLLPAEDNTQPANHCFHLSRNFPLSILKQARRSNPSYNIDSLLLSAFKTALKETTNQNENKAITTASVGLVPGLFESKFQNRCYWITGKWNFSKGFLTVHRSRDDIVTWLRDMCVERLPLAFQDNLIEREGLDLFATLVNIPLTSRKGTIFGKKVRKITSFTPEPNPIQIGVILTTYGDDCIVSCSVDKNVISIENMDNFFKIFIQEFERFAK